jgi:photosystem II stability/assembly factor-like uncharacterized protein
MRAAILILALTTTAHAQWTLQDSRTTADLRGIDNVGGGVAWASGTNGTVLRTEDAGFEWQVCTIPPGAEHLDFRGIQAFDNNTAIVMSSGPGDQSRLYKTTDGCQTWTLIFTNPDKDGFFDAISGSLTSDGKFADELIAGDPVKGSFTLFYLRIPIRSSGNATILPFPDNCIDQQLHLQLPLPASGCMIKLNSLVQASLKSKDDTPFKAGDIPSQYKSPVPRNNEALFAASNSSLTVDPTVRFSPNIAIVTGGPNGARFLHYRNWPCAGMACMWWRVADVPLAASESAGAFSLAAIGKDFWQGVIVGGDYKKPEENKGTGAYTKDEGKSWHPSDVPPHGYRSSVAYDPTTKTWITVGPNGTDISTDDGRNWHPLHPNLKFNEPPDADQHWNALSLPYAVGPHGRIATLRPSAIAPITTAP